MIRPAEVGGSPPRVFFSFPRPGVAATAVPNPKKPPLMEFIEIGGQKFALGCHERTAAAGSLRPCLEESIDLIPQDKWEPCDFSDLVPPVALQGKHGSCAGMQCTDAAKTAAAIAGEVWDVSPWDLYRQICGGEDEGASIHDALKVLHDRGVCTMASVPDFTLDATDTPQQTAEAARHQVRESFDCPTTPAIATAIQCRFPTPLGVAVYQNFEQLEEIGGRQCIPRPRGRLRGLHCVLGCGLEYIGGVWRAKIATKSWGLQFGDQGCAWYPLDWITDQVADAWCIRAVTTSEI